MKLRTSVIAVAGMLWAFSTTAGATEDGEALFKAKCAVCHTTSRPNDISTLVAPPVMGIMRHVKMQYPNKNEAVAFIKEYTLDPQESKAVCMPQKIKRFGLMPSQKENVTAEELERIAAWMFDSFPAQNAAGGKACGTKCCNTAQTKNTKGKACKTTQQKPAKRTPFLVTGLMPHLTKLVKQNWDNPTLALNPKQKAKLLKVRKMTMKGVQTLSPKVKMLEQEIATLSASGEHVDRIMPFVLQLSELKSKATRVHLQCIYDTKQILTPEQVAFLLK